MINFQREKFNNLTIRVRKNQLNELVQEVNELQYGVFWGFDRGKMILTIYKNNEKNSLTFVRHKRYMELICVDLSSTEIIEILDRILNYSSSVQVLREQEEKMRQSVQYHEIDYYLTELHDYLVQGDTMRVSETKAILVDLLRNGIQIH
ncbi:hypothetical protein [Bacillus sp. FJAT-45037]|uniref:hypothetical protein n=1 Tax=Bacillus sp. FJAT-45037 TaxID=2011007 RepID=UPI000C23C42D|nr:hypothetical protein [Bacillus sp. FJAT-45037]